MATRPRGLSTARRLGRRNSFMPRLRDPFRSTGSDSSWVEPGAPEQPADAPRPPLPETPDQRSGRMRSRTLVGATPPALDARPFVYNGDEVVLRPWRGGGGCCLADVDDAAVLAARTPGAEERLRLMKASEGAPELESGDHVLVMAGHRLLHCATAGLRPTLAFSVDVAKEDALFRICDLEEGDPRLRHGAPFHLEPVKQGADFTVARHAAGFSARLDGVQLVLAPRSERRLPLRFTTESPDLPSAAAAAAAAPKAAEAAADGQQFFYSQLDAATPAYHAAVRAAQFMRDGQAVALIMDAFGVSAGTHAEALAAASSWLLDAVAPGFVGSQDSFALRARLWVARNQQRGAEARATGDFYHRDAFVDDAQAAHFHHVEAESLAAEDGRVVAELSGSANVAAAATGGCCGAPAALDVVAAELEDCGPEAHVPSTTGAWDAHALYILLAKVLLQQRNPDMVVPEDCPARVFAARDGAAWLHALSRGVSRQAAPAASRLHAAHAVHPEEPPARALLATFAVVHGVRPLFCALTRLLLLAQPLAGALRFVEPLASAHDALLAHLGALQAAVQRVVVVRAQWPATAAEERALAAVADGTRRTLEAALAAFREHFPGNRPVGALGTVVDTYQLVCEELCSLRRSPISLAVRAHCVLRMHQLMAGALMPAALAPLARGRLPVAALLAADELPPCPPDTACVRCDALEETTCRSCGAPVCRACCSFLVLDRPSAAVVCVCAHCVTQSSRVRCSSDDWACPRAYAQHRHELSQPRLRLRQPAAALPSGAVESCMGCNGGDSLAACGGCGSRLCAQCCRWRMVDDVSGERLVVCESCFDVAVEPERRSLAGHRLVPHEFLLPTVCDVCAALLLDPPRAERAACCEDCGASVCHACAQPSRACDGCGRAVCARCVGPTLFDTNLGRLAVVCTGCLRTTGVNYAALRDGVPTIRLVVGGGGSAVASGECGCCAAPLLEAHPCVADASDGPLAALEAARHVPLTQVCRLAQRLAEQLAEDTSVFVPSFCTVDDLNLDRLVAAEMYALLEQLVCACLGRPSSSADDSLGVLQLLISLRGLWDLFEKQGWWGLPRVDLVEHFDSFVPLWMEATVARLEPFVLRIFSRDREACWRFQREAEEEDCLHCPASEDLFAVVITSMAHGGTLAMLPRELRRRHTVRFCTRVVNRLVLRLSDLLAGEALGTLGEHPSNAAMAALVSALGIAPAQGDVHVSEATCVLLNSLYALRKQSAQCMAFIAGEAAAAFASPLPGELSDDDDQDDDDQQHERPELDVDMEMFDLELRVCGAQGLPGGRLEGAYVEAHLVAGEDVDEQRPIVQAAATEPAVDDEQQQHGRCVWDHTLRLQTHDPRAKVRVTVRHRGGFVGSCDLWLEPGARYRASVELQGLERPAMRLPLDAAPPRMPRSEFDACVRCAREFDEQTPHGWCASCGGINCALCCSNEVVDADSGRAALVCSHCFRHSKRVAAAAAGGSGSRSRSRSAGWLSLDVSFRAVPLEAPVSALLSGTIDGLVERLVGLLGLALRPRVEALLFVRAGGNGGDLRTRLEPLFEYLERELSTVCDRLYDRLREQVLLAAWGRLVLCFASMLLPTAPEVALAWYMGVSPLSGDESGGSEGEEEEEEEEQGEPEPEAGGRLRSDSTASVVSVASVASAAFLARRRSRLLAQRHLGDAQVRTLRDALPLVEQFFAEGLSEEAVAARAAPLSRVLELWEADTAALVALHQPPTAATRRLCAGLTEAQRRAGAEVPGVLVRAILGRRATLQDPEALHVVNSLACAATLPWDDEAAGGKAGVVPRVQGWLQKLGNHVPTWKRRWCVLQSAPDNDEVVFLSYYKRPGGEPRGHIEMARVERVAENMYPFGFSLALSLSDGPDSFWHRQHDSGRVFNFIAESDDDLERWWAALGPWRGHGAASQAGESRREVFPSS